MASLAYVGAAAITPTSNKVGGLGLVSVPSDCKFSPIAKQQPFSSSIALVVTKPSLYSRVLIRIDNTNNSRRRRAVWIRAAAETMTTEKQGIKIVKNPPQSVLSDLGVPSWPKWGCPPSTFPWTYSSKETCYLLKGKVKVTPDGSDEAVEIGADDLVEFPKGMSCTWDVSEAVDKHYKFE